MRVGADACCWSNRRGFGRFTRELLTQMAAARPQHLTLVVDRHTAETWPLPAGAHVEVVDVEPPTRAASASGARSVGDLWRLSRAATRARFDAFFFPAVYTFYPLLGTTPVVVGFHDAIAEQHPGLVFGGARSRAFWAAKTWLARRQARRIVTVSESARRDVVRAFGVAESTVRIVREAAAPEFRCLADREAQDETRRRYGVPDGRLLLLHVGGLSPHKNLARLLSALARLDPSLPWHLLLAGDARADGFRDCHAELLEVVARHNLADRVTFAGFVPDPDLVALYNAATMLVLPSLGEGFGLPAVEAMACGLPVAASTAGSLPEVLGGAGALFDPNDPDHIAETIAGLLRDPVRRERLRQAGLERAKSFSWTAAADATWRVLDEAARA
jgi:glycosyltransferase involved in cell wall biosynthesis